MRSCRSSFPNVLFFPPIYLDTTERQFPTKLDPAYL